jgi:hypothetical protein
MLKRFRDTKASSDHARYRYPVIVTLIPSAVENGTGPA